MNYDIFSRTAPAMPKPGKGTEIVKLLLSQVSKEMREPLLPMTIPALAAHVANVELMYSLSLKKLLLPLLPNNMPLLPNNMPLLLDKDGLLTMQKRGWSLDIRGNSRIFGGITPPKIL